MRKRNKSVNFNCKLCNCEDSIPFQKRWSRRREFPNEFHIEEGYFLCEPCVKLYDERYVRKIGMIV